MRTRRPLNPGHPLVMLVGLVITLFGLAILSALGAMLYDNRLSTELVLLGIPATLLTEVLGVAALCTGGAIFAAAWSTRRRMIMGRKL